MSTTYTANSQKRAPIDVQRLKIYLWAGAAFCFIQFLISMSGYEAEERWPLAVNNVWRAVYIVAANYWFFDHALPMLSRKHIGRSLLLLAGQFFLYSFCLYAWRYVGIQLHIWTALTTFDSFLDGVCNQCQYGMVSFFFFGVVIHIHDHIRLKQTAQQLRIEKQEAELNYLKSQTNPHFLFNTLNNIYSLARDKSDLAPESILRLSEILRFMLYQSGRESIPIEQEVKVIEDYIALERLRYDHTLRVDFQHEIQDMKQPVPPLLLIPLVENAFKHGVSESTGRPFVEVHLALRSRHLSFLVKNSLEKPPDGGDGQPPLLRPGFGGQALRESIGLSNLRRQLELLYSDYELSAAQAESAFTVSLKINLASHV